MSGPCVVPLNFPTTIANRSSLPRIQYRIGTYSDFRAKMFSALDRSPLLLGWTHRQPDDPGIALLEGAAILGDILTFYQELYANEAWLRTAAWDQSIAALVRVIGYRPAPGLGGTGLISIEINGASAVPVPAGFPFSAQIAGMSAPANFETSQSVVALPSLGRFSLYAPSKVQGIYANQSSFGVNADQLADAGVTLKVNDRLMLVEKSNVAKRQIVVIKGLQTVLDQTVITIAGTWQQGSLSGAMTAYKLGRTFRAFGYNAPATEFVLSGTTQTSTPVSTSMRLRDLLAAFPLDRQVDDLSAGITMLLDLQVTDRGQVTNSFQDLTAVSVTSGTDSVGPMQGGVTKVQFPVPTYLNGALHGPVPYVLVERRTAICYEVSGRAFGVTGIRASSAPFDTSELDYFGDGASYEALDGRLLQFVALNPDSSAARVEEATAAIDRTQIGSPSSTEVRRLSLSAALTQFTPADFLLSTPAVVVFGNIVPMTQGKSQAPAVLGNGDARQTQQSFRLPKSPLTWLLNEALAPPRQAELTILVSQIEWTEVDSLFASGPKDQVYILREDSNGDTWVQFGDGVNGATLPSGVGNVMATYRSGNGANGSLQSGAKPQANGQLANLGTIGLYNEVTGGTADEDSAHIRQTAPGRVEELGRIVSLSDFEFEALALPGVEKSLAIWDVEESIPLLKLTVLMSDDTPAQLSSVQASMIAANASRGANRFPVLVVDASLEYVYAAVTIGLLPSYQQGPVTTAVTAALGVLPSDGSTSPAGGLFSVDRRDLGEEEYASRIEGTIQNVEGVAWVEVTALGSLGTAVAPSQLAVPSPVGLSPVLACANDRVLALYASHLSIAAGAA